MLKLRKISDPWESKDAIHYAGQKLFTHCYNGRSNDTPSRQLFIQLKTYVKPIYLDIPGFAVNMIWLPKSVFSFIHSHVRYEGMAAKDKINPDRLPPTERATYYHTSGSFTDYDDDYYYYHYLFI